MALRKKKYIRTKSRRRYVRRNSGSRKYARRSNPGARTNTGQRALTTVQALRLSPKKLAERLLEWHGGGGSMVYAVGSHLYGGHRPPDAYWEKAARELLNLKRDAKFPETVTAGDIQETRALATAVRMLHRKMSTGKSENPNSKKVFHTMQNVGRAKYVVNHHDGKKTHRDGSPFFDIAIFSNKKKLEAFIQKLRSNGYVERGY